MKNIKNMDLDRESETGWSEEERSENDCELERGSEWEKEELSVDALIEVNKQYIIKTVAANYGKNGLSDLDIEIIFRDAVTAYRDNNTQEFDDLMTIILAKYEGRFKTAPIKKIQNEPKEYNGKYHLILLYIHEQEIKDNAYFFYLQEIMESIKSWAANGIPSDEDFVFRKQMERILYRRIYNHFDSTYFRKGDPRIGVDSYSADNDDKAAESYYVQIADSTQRTDEQALLRMSMEQAFYSILNKNMRADKVIGTAYRIFLYYDDNDIFWEEAKGKNFIHLFDGLVQKLRQMYYLDFADETIACYRDWLEIWETYEEKLDITINGSYVITEDYIKAKDTELTDWTSKVRASIKKQLVEWTSVAKKPLNKQNEGKNHEC